MFGTFTGSARKPRNVNLSGSAGNPFSNTSWTPSAVSNPTKAVADAQAERGKRQADRQRLKAAGQIQRTWRGHKSRRQLADARRTTFDALYASNDGHGHLPKENLALGFNLLLSFFKPAQHDDIARLLAFARACETIQIDEISPDKAHPSRMEHFASILTSGMEAAAYRAQASFGRERFQVFVLLKLAERVIEALPWTLLVCASSYFGALSTIFKYEITDERTLSQLLDALSTPFRAAAGTDLEAICYRAFAVRFLAEANISLFENNISLYVRVFDIQRLSGALLDEGQQITASPDGQLWQLAHLIAIGTAAGSSGRGSGYLDILQALLARSSSDISLRLGSSPEASLDPQVSKSAPSLDPYVSKQLLSLVGNEGLAELIRDLAAESSGEGNDSAVLPAYISTLLLCFPTQADEIRMRLFLSTIPTPYGETPVFQYIWQGFSSSGIFKRLSKNFNEAVSAMRQYFHGTQERTVESEWRVAVMFLELYIFVLRLSDDDDFFSTMRGQAIRSARPPSRLQACSLGLPELTALTAFLKNTAFAMHYKTRDITEPMSERERSTSTLNALAQPQKASASLDYGSFKNLITSAIKMLYERDSRKQFLPPGHWLMTSSLEKEDFITAVIAEELRRRQEEEDGSDFESEDDDDAPFGRPNPHLKAERLRRKHREMQKQRRLAEMGPKLEILKHMPFVVPFDTRVKIFRQFIDMDRLSRGAPAPGFGGGAFGRGHAATIRRGYAFDDAYKELFSLGDGLKDPIHITFKDQWGADEAGIDGGGVTKEFLTSVTTEAFAQEESEPSMFTSSYSGLLFPDPKAADVLRERMRQSGLSDMDQEWRAEIINLVKQYEFLGRIIGKCMYEGILIDIAFAGFFLLQWSSAAADGAYKGSINDLRDIDEELYKGMLRLKDYPGDVSELDLNFTIEDQISLPGQPIKTMTRNLIPNGDNVLVTNDNRLLYISYVARHRLVAQSATQTSAFLRGLREMIRPSWLSMFNQIELQRLVGGDSSEIDIDDLRRNTIYGGLYVIGDDNEEHPTVKLFWKVMRSFTDKERRDVIKYVSSTPRAPLLGFSQLTPKFSIRDSGADESRLPSTSTCVNLLKLPRYRTEKTLREKLLYAVQSGAGFDLS